MHNIVHRSSSKSNEKFNSQDRNKKLTENYSIESKHTDLSIIEETQTHANEIVRLANINLSEVKTSAKKYIDENYEEIIASLSQDLPVISELPDDLDVEKEINIDLKKYDKSRGINFVLGTYTIKFLPL